MKAAVDECQSLELLRAVGPEPFNNSLQISGSGFIYHQNGSSREQAAE